MLQWTLWAATEASRSSAHWYYHTQMLPPDERKPEVAADAAAKLPKRLADPRRRARRTATTSLGGEFTLADLNVVAVLFRAPQFGLDAYPRLKAWHARCLARPAAKAAIALREAKAPA